jgi:hypothetical protein
MEIIHSSIQQLYLGQYTKKRKPHLSKNHLGWSSSMRPLGYQIEIFYHQLKSVYNLYKRNEKKKRPVQNE